MTDEELCLAIDDRFIGIRYMRAPTKVEDSDLQFIELKDTLSIDDKLLLYEVDLFNHEPLVICEATVVDIIDNDWSPIECIVGVKLHREVSGIFIDKITCVMDWSGIS